MDLCLALISERVCMARNMNAAFAYVPVECYSRGCIAHPQPSLTSTQMQTGVNEENRGVVPPVGDSVLVKKMNWSEVDCAAAFAQITPAHFQDSSPLALFPYCSRFSHL